MGDVQSTIPGLFCRRGRFGGGLVRWGLGRCGMGVLGGGLGGLFGIMREVGREAVWWQQS